MFEKLSQNTTSMFSKCKTINDFAYVKDSSMELPFIYNTLYTATQISTEARILEK